MKFKPMHQYIERSLVTLPTISRRPHSASAPGAGEQATQQALSIQAHVEVDLDTEDGALLGVGSVEHNCVATLEQMVGRGGRQGQSWAGGIRGGLSTIGRGKGACGSKIELCDQSTRGVGQGRCLPASSH